MTHFQFQSGGDDDPMSDADINSRDGDDDASPVDALARVPEGDMDQETMEKFRRQVSRFILHTSCQQRFHKLHFFTGTRREGRDREGTTRPDSRQPQSADLTQPAARRWTRRTRSTPDQDIRGGGDHQQQRADVATAQGHDPAAPAPPGLGRTGGFPPGISDLSPLPPG